MLNKRHIREYDDYRNHKHQQLDHEPISSSTNLQKCFLCDRRFTENRLIEHQRVCEKSKKLHFNSSHKYHYDSQLHRWKGLNYHINPNQSNAKHFPKTYWREKHQQFEDIVKGQFNSIQSSNDRPYQCSQCQRKFTTENALTKHERDCTKKYILKKNKC